MGGQSEINLSPRLSSVLLNGLNYVPWSRVVALGLGGKSLFGHVDGTKAAPKTNNENMWDELGLYRPPTTNLSTLQQRAEQDKVFQLLTHIKPDFENLRGQILMGSGVPFFSSVCASIQHEETRRMAMNIEPKSTVIQSEASALMVDNKKVDTKKHSGNFANPTGNPLEGECLDDFIPIPIVDTNPIDSPQGDASPETSTVAPPVEVSSPDEVAPSIYLPHNIDLLESSRDPPVMSPHHDTQAYMLKKKEDKGAYI
ncbi:hypothetical protein RHGRI_020083 [Rhododendron griersonianum]|uniref:Retrotransposon Copia-like N-terminal domain-containing protein n=1 Tax=Rhododendron griersonianum TaxID=479676 RepID=A0AAV6JHX2_9ERIC|nr:hypothetical protein RHGRI_020083 [Rhododendron griersonianum]